MCLCWMCFSNIRIPFKNPKFPIAQMLGQKKDRLKSSL
jgi:hypothetical protein